MAEKVNQSSKELIEEVQEKDAAKEDLKESQDPTQEEGKEKEKDEQTKIEAQKMKIEVNEVGDNLVISISCLKNKLEKSESTLKDLKGRIEGRKSNQGESLEALIEAHKAELDKISDLATYIGAGVLEGKWRNELELRHLRNQAEEDVLEGLEDQGIWDDEEGKQLIQEIQKLDDKITGYQNLSKSLDEEYIKLKKVAAELGIKGEEYLDKVKKQDE